MLAVLEVCHRRRSGSPSVGDAEVLSRPIAIDRESVAAARAPLQHGRPVAALAALGCRSACRAAGSGTGDVCGPDAPAPAPRLRRGRRRRDASGRLQRRRQVAAPAPRCHGVPFGCRSASLRRGRRPHDVVGGQAAGGPMNGYGVLGRPCVGRRGARARWLVGGSLRSPRRSSRRSCEVSPTHVAPPLAFLQRWPQRRGWRCGGCSSRWLGRRE